MKQLVGRYLSSNNHYYVGSIDLENKRIWVSVDASDKFEEFQLQNDIEKGLYFEDEGQKVYVDQKILTVSESQESPI